MKRLKLIAIASVIASPLLAQDNNSDSIINTAIQDEQAFTFTEAQLGEDDDMSQNVTIIHSNNLSGGISVQSRTLQVSCF